LIAYHLESVGALDLLLLLRGQPERAWTSEDVCEALGSPLRWAERELASLRRGGLVALHDGRYRYAPDSERTHAAVDAIARAWRHDRSGISRLIFSPRRRDRSGT
jgi:DNA-binding IclR family transcriptional regulator